MLDSLITSKTRLKLLLKFFLNPENKAYLRSLETEFEESSNGIRVELNRLEQADMLKAVSEGNKKIYCVNTQHPLYADINSIVRKYLGLDVLIENIVAGLGGLKQVYLIGKLADGLESNVIDLLFVGELNLGYQQQIITKAEKLLNKEIRSSNYTVDSEDLAQQLEGQSHLLLWSN